MLNIAKQKNKVKYTEAQNIELKLNDIIQELIKYLCIHIKNQVNAGADVIQIFDSGQDFYLKT